jgi:hypothetical protein
MMPIISILSGVTVDSFLHNEPGFGKTLLDSFFGVLTWHLQQALREPARDTTLIHSLATACRGLRNTTVQILSFPKSAFECATKTKTKTKTKKNEKASEEACLKVDALTSRVPQVDDVSTYRDWSYQYDRAVDGERHVVRVTAVGRKFTDIDGGCQEFVLSDNKNWRGILEEQVARNNAMAAVTQALSSAVFSSSSSPSPCTTITGVTMNVVESDFDGYAFGASADDDESNASPFYGPLTELEQRLRDELAAKKREEHEHLVKVAASSDRAVECKTCGSVFIRAHKCKGPKPEKVNLVTFAIDYALEQIREKWSIESDFSTRMRTLLEWSGNSSLVVATFGYGWANPEARRRNTSDTVKMFLWTRAKEYYDTGRRLTLHKGMQLLYTTLAPDGLPLFSAADLISPSTCASILKSYYAPAMELRKRERLVAQGSIDRSALNQRPYHHSKAPALKQECGRLGLSYGPRSGVETLRTLLVNNLENWLPPIGLELSQPQPGSAAAIAATAAVPVAIVYLTSVGKEGGDEDDKDDEDDVATMTTGEFVHEGDESSDEDE